jgi:hypothetical protein
VVCEAIGSQAIRPAEVHRILAAKAFEHGAQVLEIGIGQWQWGHESARGRQRDLACISSGNAHKRPLPLVLQISSVQTQQIPPTEKMFLKVAKLAHCAVPTRCPVLFRACEPRFMMLTPWQPKFRPGHVPSVTAMPISPLPRRTLHRMLVLSANLLPGSTRSRRTARNRRIT